MKCSLGISNFLEEISSLSHSIVLCFFSLITEEGFLISPCYSLELCLQMDMSFLFSLTFHFSSFHSYLLRPTQTTILPFCISFSWVWSWSLPPVQCHKPPSWTVACTKLFCPWDFLGKNTGVGCHFLLQGIFQTQGLNPGLLHCRQTLYCLSHEGSPM